ncbi:MAG: PAS domain S-box protein [Chloroflexi bacterium]|nr:PAS domain S-box protein [Chloroflexota bacterium]
MSWQTILYFCSILLTCGLTGFLAWYAWRQTHVTGARSYAYMVLAESLLALTEIGTMLVGTETQAALWFSLRVPFAAVIPVFWLFFALEYSGRGDWLSKLVRAALFAIPLITQVVMITGSLHGLWLVQDVAFEKIGLFWIADTRARIPAFWYLVHTFYSTLLLAVGAGVLVVAAWRKPKLLLGQALLVSLGALTALGLALSGVFNFLPELRFNLFVPGIGFSAVCYALAIFRFQFLKLAPSQESGSRLTDLKPEEKGSLAVLVLIFILFVSGLAASGYLAYRNYERQFRAQVESEISAIAELKVNELVDWRGERLADAEVLYENPVLAALIGRFFENPADLETKAQLQDWLISYRSYPEYDRVRLLDVQGVTQLSDPLDLPPTSPEVIAHIPEALDAGQVIMVDFYRSEGDENMYMGLLVPIVDRNAGGQVVGLIALSINPLTYLYPFLENWPSPRESAETLLIRRDGGDVLFLNPLRFEADAALNLRFPLADAQLPAVKAALGQTGIVEGLDYRGQQVIADIRPVPESLWFLVSKMDTAEVYAPLRERLWQMFFLFGALTLVAGAGLILIWRQQRLRYYKTQVLTLDALRLSEEKFRLAFDTSPDSVAITRLSDGMFVSVNKGFEQISGYTREQAIGKTSTEINIWKNPEDRRNVVEGLKATGEVRNYEAPFLAQDGEIYGLISAVIIELNGEPHILNIVRDITERKRAEQALHESEERFRRLAENAQDLIYRYELSPKRGFSYVSPAAMTLTGYSPEEHYADPELGYKLVHPDDQHLLAETIQGGDAIRKPLVLRWIRKDGSMLWTEQRNVPIYTEDGTLVAMEGISIDITERKRMDEKLRESETNLSTLIENTDGSIWAVDHQYGLIVGNREFHRNTSAALGRRLEMGESVLPPGFPVEVNAEWQGLYDRALRGESFTFEMQTHFRESPHYIEYHFSPIREAADEIRGVTVYGRDITERKQAEDTLIQVNDRLALAQRLAGAGIWDWDLATGKLNWSPEFFHLFGLDPARTDATFDTWRGALHPDDVQGAEQRIDQAIRNHVPLFNEYRIVTPSDETRWIGAWGDITYNERGEAQRMTGLCIDITERKQVETALRESERRFRDIMENVNLISAMLDVHGNIIFANNYLLKLTGWQLEEVLGRNWFELLIPTEAEVRRVLLEGIKEGAVPLYYQNEILTRNGERRLIDWSNTLLRDAQGNSAGIAGIGVDITVRKRAEDAVRASEEKFRQAFNTSPIAISISRLKGGGFVSINKSFERFTGYSEAEVIGKTAEELNLWQSPEVHQSLIKELRAKGEVRDYETPILTRSGEMYCLTSASIIEINGEPHILTLAVDITKRKQAEQALYESENKYRTLVQNMQVGMVAHRPDTSILLSNAMASQLLGLSQDQMLGKTAIDPAWHFVHEDGTPVPLDEYPVNLALAENQPVRNLVLGIIHPARGFPTWVQCDAYRVQDLEGNLQQVIVTFFDITERRVAEEQLLKTLDELKRSNTELEQFAYVASHDLQEPLRAVAGMVQLLQQRYKDQLDGRADEYIGLAVEGATRMQTLINDLLAYSRVERRGSPIRETDANAALQSALRNLGAAIFESGAVVTNGSLPTLEADATQLTQLFQNLIGNAIKFRGQDTPNIHVEARDLGNAWQFSVSDNGIGIEPQYYERIFLVFQRLHTRREYPGTGIGLSICKKIVERHGGRIWIESTPGQGATFHFTIPHRR